jgi:hypothetical protein
VAERPGAAPTSRGLCLVALAVLTAAIYGPNLHDYFLGDDFDLIGSLYDKPATYFLRLLADNASGDAWKTWGLDAAQGRGYLRPLHIWLLKLDSLLWGTNPLGFHWTATVAAIAAVCTAFLILDELGVGSVWAFVGAAALGSHPILSTIVPFIAAREETITTALCLAAFLFFLRFRRGSSPVWPLVLFALALLTKETAVAWLALPLGHDVFAGTVPATSVERRRTRRFYGGLAGLVAVYLGLRQLAFGNVVGGDGGPTNYLSASAFVGYHSQFWHHLLGSHLFDRHGVPLLPWLAVAAFATLLGLSLLVQDAERRTWTRRALFFGPYWYLAATALFYGTYYDDRHHSLPLAGLALFFTLAADRATGGWGKGQSALFAGFALVALAWVLLPATLGNARAFCEASRVTARVREDIEAITKGLPDGGAVLLVNTPQREDPPYYFGWGLQAALGRPFTPTDVARRLRIVDRRSLAMNRSSAPMPKRFDLEIRFSERQLGRVERVFRP